MLVSQNTEDAIKVTHTLHVQTRKLGSTAEETTARDLEHVRENVLDITMTERLVLEIRERRDVAWEYVSDMVVA